MVNSRVITQLKYDLKTRIKEKMSLVLTKQNDITWDEFIENHTSKQANQAYFLLFFGTKESRF